MKKTRDLFDTSELNKQLRGHSIRGAKATFLAQGINLILSLFSVMILARLLTPEDFGLIAMVTVVTGLLSVFRDAGLSFALVQNENITHEQASSLFWVNIAISIFLMITIALLAPFLAWFYNDDRLELIALVLAISFGLGGLSIQHLAILKRQMNFDATSKIQIISALLAAITAIISAKLGIGYWSLVIQIMVNELSIVLLSWNFSRWMPSSPNLASGSLSMLKFGGYLTGFNLVNYFARNTDDLMIGKIWGGDALGVYSRAYTLSMLPLKYVNTPLITVASSTLSRLQTDPTRFRHYFKKILGVVCLLTCPLIAWMIINREELVLILLGEQWTEAVPIFAILAFSAFFQPIGNISGVIYIALGKTKRMYNWGIMSSALIVFAFICGISYGPIGVAIAYAVVITAMIYPMISYAINDTEIKVSDYMEALSVPMAATVISSLFGIAVNISLNHDFTLIINLLFTTLVMTVSYLVTAYVLNKSIFEQLTEILVESRRFDAQ